jgi:hypothetical protein
MYIDKYVVIFDVGRFGRDWKEGFVWLLQSTLLENSLVIGSLVSGAPVHVYGAS